jgi:phosphatidylserine synthase
MRKQTKKLNLRAGLSRTLNLRGYRSITGRRDSAFRARVEAPRSAVYCDGSDGKTARTTIS